MKIAVFDLDGCIADDRWRRDLIEPGDWTEYHARCGEDEPANREVVIEHKLCNHHLAFVTSRPHSVHGQTLNWLHRWFDPLEDFSLLMRPTNVATSTPELRLLSKEFGLVMKDKIVATYDNDPEVLAVYKGAGLPTQLLELPVMTVPEILRGMARTYEERNKVYGDNFMLVPGVITALFPEGVPSELITTNRWHLFRQVLSKLTRFAASNLTHRDSIHDMAVYAAMIEGEMK